MVAGLSTAHAPLLYGSKELVPGSLLLRAKRRQIACEHAIAFWLRITEPVATYSAEDRGSESKTLAHAIALACGLIIAALAHDAHAAHAALAIHAARFAHAA